MRTPLHRCEQLRVLPDIEAEYGSPVDLGRRVDPFVMLADQPPAAAWLQVDVVGRIELGRSVGNGAIRQGAAARLMRDDAVRRQIGRASCRERECQYV